MNGNGDYSTSTGYTLPTTGTVTGTYQWDSTYGGDNNTGASGNNATGEKVTVKPADLVVTTTPKPSMVTLGTTSPTLKDSAVLSGGCYPTGTLTFKLYADKPASTLGRHRGR